MEAVSFRKEALDLARCWSLLRALAERASAGDPVSRNCGLRLSESGGVLEVKPEEGWVALHLEEEGCLHAASRLPAELREMLELYLPLCVGAQSAKLVIGHIGQSLDGQIATKSGASRYVTGSENGRHMHYLRALADAIVVGADTVECDDPQLTTRLVAGHNPTRVVIDPCLRLPVDRLIFRDQAAPTLIVCASGRAKDSVHAPHVEVLEVATEDDSLPPEGIVRVLRSRGLNRLFVEGGGVTISRFLKAGCLDRLHVTISPVFLGSGRPGIVLPSIDRLDEAFRPPSRRFGLGDDVLFDCKL
jgi:diaminohydroxyphosphoribosylaminopyrimidine deaminase / 5-amino-6-(5-phosphoribosylamino)uracil reductase